MALKISKNVGLTDIVTDANQIRTEHPIAGSVVTVQLWVFNDSATKSYQNVSVIPVDTLTTDESSWVQLAPDNAGSAGTFLSGGASLALADIADSNVAKPFWARITTAAVAESVNKNDIKLRINFREYAV